MIHCLIKIANYARFHANYKKSKHYASRAYNVARTMQIYALVPITSCIIGLADGEDCADEDEQETPLRLEVEEID